MHVSARKIAFLGLMLAFTIILIILSGVFEFNTLFLLCGASFFVGIAINEVGFVLGSGFYVASILLGLILAPNKLYVLTYSMLGFYVVVIEGVWRKLVYLQDEKKRYILFSILKLVVFNIMYLPMIIFFPKLIFTGELNEVLYLVFILGGQVVLFIYDKAYHHFFTKHWTKLRRQMKL